MDMLECKWNNRMQGDWRLFYIEWGGADEI